MRAKNLYESLWPFQNLKAKTWVLLLFKTAASSLPVRAERDQFFYIGNDHIIFTYLLETMKL